MKKSIVERKEYKNRDPTFYRFIQKNDMSVCSHLLHRRRVKTKRLRYKMKLD